MSGNSQTFPIPSGTQPARAKTPRPDTHNSATSNSFSCRSHVAPRGLALEPSNTNTSPRSQRERKRSQPHRPHHTPAAIPYAVANHKDKKKKKSLAQPRCLLAQHPHRSRGDRQPTGHPITSIVATLLPCVSGSAYSLQCLSLHLGLYLHLPVPLCFSQLPGPAPLSVSHPLCVSLSSPLCPSLSVLPYISAPQHPQSEIAAMITVHTRMSFTVASRHSNDDNHVRKGRTGCGVPSPYPPGRRPHCREDRRCPRC